MSDANTKDTGRSDVQEMAKLVTGMSRFLTRFSKMTPFQEAGMGLAEWSALSIIAERNGVNNRQLAVVLGVSAQRVNQISDSLKNASHIAVNPSADDARKKIMSVTPSGTARLKELNAKLHPIISTALSKQQKSISRANRAINAHLMRIVTPAKLLERKSEKTLQKKNRITATSSRPHR